MWLAIWSNYEDSFPLQIFPDEASARSYIEGLGSSSSLHVEEIPAADLGPSLKWVISYHPQEPRRNMVYEMPPFGAEQVITSPDDQSIWMEVYALTQADAIAKFEAAHHVCFT